MRVRVRADWQRDLANRHGLESLVATGLRDHAAITLCTVNTASMNDLDFGVRFRSGIGAAVELKEKRQRYSSWWSEQWSIQNPERAAAELFVLDELSMRKLTMAGPHAYLLIADSSESDSRWFGCSIGDVLFSDFVRVARPLQNQVVKGKVIVALDDMPVADESLSAAIDGLDLLSRSVSACWASVAPWESSHIRQTQPNLRNRLPRSVPAA
jgi:hypothetical protein